MVVDRFHLSYCTNVHPGRDWEETMDNLRRHVPEVKRLVSPDRDFGLGLRLSDLASRELGISTRLTDFKAWLDSQGVYVFTMNGFPYGNFHGQPVKDQVHAPDWTSEARFRYTKRLFQQLSALLPKGVSGGISTSPVSYRHWHRTAGARKEVMEAGARYMMELALFLHEWEESTGQYLHLDIEPEPDGMLENSEEVIAYFTNFLIPIGQEMLFGNKGLGPDAAAEVIQRHMTVCYDVCHFSLAYENPSETFDRFRKAGIRVGKVQVSAALKVISEPDVNDMIWRDLAAFNEPVYLHQVTEKVGDTVRTYPDLPQLLETRPRFKELRAHFHVPIFLERYGTLQSTQDQILKVLPLLQNDAVSDHLEVETYTWEVLPAGLKTNLDRSIARELTWVRKKLEK